MTESEFLLREGCADDLPAIATLDGSFSNEWVLSSDGAATRSSRRWSCAGGR